MSCEGFQAPPVTFNDELISTLSGVGDDETVDAVRFDFSQKIGRITMIEPLQQFSGITELSLIGHDISNIIALKGLSNLKRINLSWNKLTTQSLTPLFSLLKLEYVNLNYNSIETIARSFQKLKKLRILKLAGNQINGREQLLRLKNNLNLVNLDMEGTSVFNDNDCILFCIYALPHLIVLNRDSITLDKRTEAANRFDRTQLNELMEIKNNLLSENNELSNNLSKLKNRSLKQKEKVKELTSSLNTLTMDRDELSLKCKEQEDVIEQRNKELVDERNNVSELRSQIFNSFEDNQDLSIDENIIHENEKMKNEITSLKQKNEEMKLQLAISNKKIDLFQEEIKKFGEENKSLQQNNDILKKTIIKIQKENEETKQKKENEKQITKLQKEIINKLKNEFLKVDEEKMINLNSDEEDNIIFMDDNSNSFSDEKLFESICKFQNDYYELKRNFEINNQENQKKQNELEEKLQRLIIERKEKDDYINKLELSNNDMSEQLKCFNNLIEQKQDSIEGIKEKINNNEMSVQKIENLEKKICSLKQKVNKYKEIIQKKENQTVDNHDKVDNEKHEIEGDEDQKQYIEKLENENKKLQQKLMKYEQMNTKGSNQIDEHNDKKDQNSQFVKENKKNQTKLNKMEESNVKKDIIEQDKSQILLFKSQISKFKTQLIYIQNEAQNKIKALVQKNEDIKLKSNQKIQALQKQVSQLSNQNATLQEEISNHKVNMENSKQTSIQFQQLNEELIKMKDTYTKLQNENIELHNSLKKNQLQHSSMLNSYQSEISKIKKEKNEKIKELNEKINQIENINFELKEKTKNISKIAIKKIQSLETKNKQFDVNSISLYQSITTSNLTPQTFKILSVLIELHKSIINDSPTEIVENLNTIFTIILSEPEQRISLFDDSEIPICHSNNKKSATPFNEGIIKNYEKEINELLRIITSQHNVILTLSDRTKDSSIYTELEKKFQKIISQFSSNISMRT